MEMWRTLLVSLFLSAVTAPRMGNERRIAVCGPGIRVGMSRMQDIGAMQCGQRRRKW